MLILISEEVEFPSDYVRGQQGYLEQKFVIIFALEGSRSAKGVLWMNLVRQQKQMIQFLESNFSDETSMIG